MTSKHPWISAWFVISAFVIAWDVGYCFMRFGALDSKTRHKLTFFSRPRSMLGGDLHWIWKPYALYAEVDHVRNILARF
jgi:hypothetical protein